MQEEIKYIIKDSALGSVLVAQSERGIRAILIADDSLKLLADLQDRFPKAYIEKADAQLEKLASKIVQFIENPKGTLDIPLDIRGTDFQKKVWAALQEIPAGKTASYTDIAHNLNIPNAVRAVAGACAANALAVVIPCHRIVRRDGALSGYHWGVDRKKKLLEIEGSR
ncbi:methylated-DNA--[protein]-cysteine S-methyltransferase [Candidatus Paracaedibacter symbiosus]|uniref:methylated-DNA--[protein]-cysteine S-methyltransferase n=1 Tax=Candidatus Paracaedibacter symbiosus TaxID=244582 RepID=UPI00068A1B93|nr:methylated-DNA--[protein]-cysteine S-methyltransferase [Candidatus Paracaedibacter symbiosus]